PEALKRMSAYAPQAPKTEVDLRRVLDDKEVDVVAIATPNHWHALQTIWACQAGKDVYVEKPMSHNIHEGRVAVEAARRYNRIVQHGTQSRSKSGYDQVVAAIQSGKLGKLLVSRGMCYKRRDSIGFKEATTPPPELDFDLWLGPAPRQPYHENLVHYNWHWFWDTGNGDIGNQGVHEMDKARWAIAGATLPRSVISLGGRFGYEDQGQTANTQIAVFDYGETQLVFEVRGLPSDKYLDQGVGNIYHLEAGTIRGTKFYPTGSETPEPLPQVEVADSPGKDNFSNFIAAMRSGQRSDLNAEILDGHYSSALCHLANASYRCGEMVPFNRKTKAFGDNQEAYETLARMEEHLTAHGLKLEEMRYRLGRKLIVDPATGGVRGDHQANEILTGGSRKGFEVPDRIA
ncbi:MAG: Gfo/Idh/MocA family oxidoreductase, partial [Planctomycetes bacterium]|nr:Gfo/Idh/MocA family oxidoreductase [Planctomycetota bacterium]